MSQPLSAVVFTGKRGLYEWLNFLDSDEWPGGLSPGKEYTVRMATAASVKSADQVEVLAAILWDGRWQGDLEYVRMVFSDWAGTVLQGSRISAILARLPPGQPSDAEIESARAELRALPETPATALDLAGASAADLRLPEFLTGPLGRISFESGLKNSKNSALSTLERVRSGGGPVEALADLARRYSTRMSSARRAIYGFAERSAQ